MVVRVGLSNEKLNDTVFSRAAVRTTTNSTQPGFVASSGGLELSSRAHPVDLSTPSTGSGRKATDAESDDLDVGVEGSRVSLFEL